MINLLLLDHFYPVMSYKKKATNYCVRFGRSLWSAREPKLKSFSILVAVKITDQHRQYQSVRKCFHFEGRLLQCSISLSFLSLRQSDDFVPSRISLEESSPIKNSLVLNTNTSEILLAKVFHSGFLEFFLKATFQTGNERERERERGDRNVKDRKSIYRQANSSRQLSPLILLADVHHPFNVSFLPSYLIHSLLLSLSSLSLFFYSFSTILENHCNLWAI